MVSDRREPCAAAPSRGLIVGNYCHDVLIRDGAVVAESLGGAASFIAAVLDGLLISSDYVSKVGSDFAYPVSHAPFVSSSSTTTLFHAHFSAELDAGGREDRVLKRVRSCDPVTPSDLPESRFDFGMAVGVGGEISPEILERILNLCSVVFVDIQSLIRVFDPVDGTVNLVDLKESGFFHLLPRIGVLKASAEEAPYLDVEEVRKWCCVVVTNGKKGCTVHWRGGELQIAPFGTVQVDPTGAGDSFLGGFVYGIVQGLAVPDAALLGNFFGALTVSQIGLPKFDRRLLLRVKDEVQQRRMQWNGGHHGSIYDGLSLNFRKLCGHEEFHACLNAAKLTSTTSVMECQRDSPSFTPKTMEQSMQLHESERNISVLNGKEPSHSVNGIAFHDEVPGSF